VSAHECVFLTAPYMVDRIEKTMSISYNILYFTYRVFLILEKSLKIYPYSLLDERKSNFCLMGRQTQFSSAHQQKTWYFFLYITPVQGSDVNENNFETKIL